MALQVTCHVPDGADKDQRIDAIGGSGWKHLIDDAIRNIESRRESYWTYAAGSRVDVIVAQRPNGRKYLKPRPMASSQTTCWRCRAVPDIGRHRLMQVQMRGRPPGGRMSLFAAEPRKSHGCASKTDRIQRPARLWRARIPVSFKAHSDEAGELSLAFDEIPLNRDTEFIMHAWHRPDGRIAYFRLSGTAEGDVTSTTEHLFFNSIGPHSDRERGSYYALEARCEEALIRRPPRTPLAEPALILSLRGFRCFPEVTSSCQLGELLAAGDVRSDDPEKLSGYIQVRAKAMPSDVAKWRADAERLLDHVRRVMSFASGAILADPILTFILGNEAEISIKSRTTHQRSQIPTFHAIGRDAIFEAAVRSFFRLAAGCEEPLDGARMGRDGGNLQ